MGRSQVGYCRLDCHQASLVTVLTDEDPEGANDFLIYPM